MKFFSNLAVAATLVSSAATALASTQAPVYLVRQKTPAAPSAPSLPRQVVREIILQRLGADGSASFVDGLPENYDVEAAIDAVQQFGKEASSIFGDDQATTNNKQVFVLLDGATSKSQKSLEKLLSAKPAFYVADPPSYAANAALVDKELVNVEDKENVYIVRADLNKFPTTIEDLYEDGTINTETTDADIMIVLMPESSRVKAANRWATLSAKPQSNKADKNQKVMGELRRRQEAVMLEDATFEAKQADEEHNNDQDGVPSAPHEWATPVPKSIPACFQSFNSCTYQTANCSGHGLCVDKYALNSGRGAASALEARKGDDDKPAPVCFVCQCLSTLTHPETDRMSTTQWAGNICHKKDVSVPFWLLTSLTVLLVGIVSFSVGLLFNIGEEKLPGVIGAGVSRSK